MRQPLSAYGHAGATNHNAKLTDELVIELRSRARDGAVYRDLAAEFGIEHKTLWSAVSGRSWAHLDGVAPPVLRPLRKLDEVTVVQARRLAARGLLLTEIAERLGANPCTLFDAITGVSWKEVDDIVAPTRVQRTEGLLPHERLGESNPLVKLTEEIVIDARDRARQGVSVSALAREHGISIEAMRRAVRGMNWAYLNAVCPPVV